MSEKTRWYAVSGRVHGDWEDCTEVFEAISADSARAAFRESMTSSMSTDEVASLEKEASAVAGVYITSIMVSDSPIREAESSVALSQIAGARSPRERWAPEIDRAGLTDEASRRIFAAFLDAVQDAEEIYGPGVQDYATLMLAISNNASERAENALSIHNEEAERQHRASQSNGGPSR